MVATVARSRVICLKKYSSYFSWKFFLTGVCCHVCSSDPNIKQFNSNTLQMCKIVLSYYLVQSVSNGTTNSLLKHLKQSADDTLYFWVSIFPLVYDQASHTSIDVFISLSAISYVQKYYN